MNALGYISIEFWITIFAFLNLRHLFFYKDTHTQARAHTHTQITLHTRIPPEAQLCNDVKCSGLRISVIYTVSNGNDCEHINRLLAYFIFSLL